MKFISWYFLMALASLPDCFDVVLATYKKNIAWVLEGYILKFSLFLLWFPEITKTLQNRAQVDTKEHPFNDDQVDVEPVSNKCTESTPAMQVASVVAPSVLILTVILLSLGIFYKIARYQKIRISQLKRGIKHKASREGLIKKVQELKGCGLLVRQNVPEVFQTTAVISRSCSESDYRVLLSSPHNV